jgi:hypothetical protein
MPSRSVTPAVTVFLSFEDLESKSFLKERERASRSRRDDRHENRHARP